MDQIAQKSSKNFFKLQRGRQFSMIAMGKEALPFNIK
jgi:hypothetical protein